MILGIILKIELAIYFPGFSTSRNRDDKIACPVRPEASERKNAPRISLVLPKFDPRSIDKTENFSKTVNVGAFSALFEEALDKNVNTLVVCYRLGSATHKFFAMWQWVSIFCGFLWV